MGLFSGFNRKQQQPVQHIIGRVTYAFSSFWKRLSRTKNVDDTITDYKYWDKFRNGLITGYELSSVFAQSIVETLTSWVIGRALTVRLATVDDARMKTKVEYTNDMLRRLFLSMQGEMVLLYQDLQALGDQFAIVNADASITIVPADMVDIDYDELDYRKPVRYCITTVLDDVQIEDEYTPTKRTVTVRKAGANGPVITTKTFKILIGRFPIVHFSNDRGPNEKRGHPVYENLRPILSEFNDLLKKGLQGGKVAGNPVPVFEGLFDPDETIDRMATEDDETYTDKDGNDATRKQIRWDDSSAIVLGEGGKFKFASPPVGFSEDILNLLRFLFTLIIYRTHITETLWGAGLDVGKGVEEQTPMWVRFVEGRRDRFAGKATDEKLGVQAQGGLHELAEVWLKTKALVDTKIFVGPTVVRWSDLTEKDRSLTFEWVKWLQSRGYMTGLTALEKSGLVEDVKTEFEAAQAEFEANMQKMLEFDDHTGTENAPLTDDSTTDLRKANPGASAPRGAAYAGGGR